MNGERKHVVLIAGLGNPGSEYENTRHNAGFMAIDSLLENLPGKLDSQNICSGVVWTGRFRGRKLFLQKPMTFMNNSGKAVAALAAKNGISPEEILVVYDDVDLPPGRIRIRRGGSSGGHNGVESIIEHMKSADFVRLRIGIGRDSESSQIDHVLSGFDSESGELIDKVLKLLPDAVKLILSRGPEMAMNEYNGLKLDLEKETDSDSE